MAGFHSPVPCQVCVPSTTTRVPRERSPLRRSPSSRRVIFPSLHASAALDDPHALLGEETQSSPPPPPESTRPKVISPCSSPSPAARASPLSRTVPALTSSERERLLSRLLESPPTLTQIRGRTSSDDSCSVVSSTEDCSGAATSQCPPHEFKVPTVAAGTFEQGRSSSAMPESSLFSLMLPSFDYLINPHRQHPDSPVLSVFAPRKGHTVPSPGPTSSSAQAKALVPILRKGSSSQMTSSRPPDGTRLHGRAVVSRSVSESSDLPSLTSSVSSDSLMMDDDPELSSHGRCGDSPAPPLRRGGDRRDGGAAVSFCPKVWVRIFERSQRERDCIWYTPRDFEGFRAEAMERIEAYYRHQSQAERSLLPTGTGRVLSTSSPAQRLLFSHQALQAECDLLAASTPSPLEACTGNNPNGVERILIVDPHEVCLKLLSQAFQLMFPSAVIDEALSSTEALQLVGPGERFDVVVVEERLNRVGKTNDLLGSGSTLMAGIRDSTSCQPLFIGITSHPEEDTQRLRQHGADIVWSKPPPSINVDLRNGLLRTLSLKRGGNAQARSAL